MEYHLQKNTFDHPYFQNKELKVWPKVQIPILLDLLNVCYEDTALYLMPLLLCLNLSNKKIETLNGIIKHV